MKKWLIVGIPILILGGLMFVRPPAFSNSPHTTGTTSKTGVQPGIPGGGDDGKPSYGGHEADEYGKRIKK